MNITSSLLSESSEEIQDFLQRKNKYICPQEALTYVCFPFWIVKSYRKSVSNVCIYRLSPSSGTNTAKCKQTFVKDIFIGIAITHEAFRTTFTRASVKEVPRSRSTFSALKIRECTHYKV